MKALFPECAHEVVDSANFSGERRKRAYFSSPEFDLTKLQSLTGGCTVEEWFHLDPAAGPYEMRSGTSGSKATARWHGVARPAPTLTSNGLLARNVRTGEEWRVPTQAKESLRGLPALPPTQVPSISARRAAAGWSGPLRVAPANHPFQPTFGCGVGRHHQLVCAGRASQRAWA